FEAPRFVLWRRGTQVRVTLDDQHVARVRRALALRGARAAVVPGGVPEPSMPVRAIGTGLGPARLREEDLDIIEVRVASLGEATARALRRPFRHWPLGARRRASCGELLRGNDLLFEIRRTAWCARETARANRRILRPVLFDATAAPSAIRVYASAGSLTRWIEG
ncbi:MAG: hypothetical protein ACYC9W_10220, partial [Candidatus Limnocylindria bacterium]